MWPPLFRFPSLFMILCASLLNFLSFLISLIMLGFSPAMTDFAVGGCDFCSAFSAAHLQKKWRRRREDMIQWRDGRHRMNVFHARSADRGSSAFTASINNSIFCALLPHCDVCRLTQKTPACDGPSLLLSDHPSYILWLLHWSQTPDTSPLT